MQLEEGIALGLGLIGIGRPWGDLTVPIPGEEHVQTFLDAAVALGITVFDTAPAYGLSEERLGKFLRSLTTDRRARLTVCTKFGEQWDCTSGKSKIDHTFTGLRNSLDRSEAHLGRIDLLQLHKATVPALRSPDFQEAISYAERRGIARFGVSVSDVETGLAACDDRRITSIQLPYNVANCALDTVVERKSGEKVVANQPPIQHGGARAD